jgi:hypothetical protein
MSTRPGGGTRRYSRACEAGAGTDGFVNIIISINTHAKITHHPKCQVCNVEAVMQVRVHYGSMIRRCLYCSPGSILILKCLYS